MPERREFLKTGGAIAVATLLSRYTLAEDFAGHTNDSLRFSSQSMELQLSRSAPEFLSLSIDGLAKGRRGANIVSESTDGGFKVATSTSGGDLRVAYRPVTARDDIPASWTVEVSSSRIVLTSEWSGNYQPAAPLVFHFNLSQVHTTVLGLFSGDNLLATPVLIHFPGQGSMRLTASVPGIGLTYTSDGSAQTASLSLPGADFEHKRIVYTLDVTAIHPHVPGIADDPRFDSFRRNWLNTLQLNPSFHALANNTASGTCAFCYYEYADIAALTPPLAEGLTALDIVRQTLDWMLGGGIADGMPAVPDRPCATSDFFPSMVIAAADCVREGRSDAWLAANYDGIRGWAESMLATDTDGDGLIEYCVSGNSGIWSDGTPKFRPSNWWDTIGFGHKDAYGNALAYRALRNMAMLAGKRGMAADMARYRAAAEKLRAAYFNRFYDAKTGVLGGWRSADGKMHDYYFLWVTGIAIHYGLVPKPEADAMMDKLLAKMKEVGYDNFTMGLPGNLVSVALKDCVDKRDNGNFGCGSHPDNADGFRNYENGGATGSFAFFTLAALYDLGRKAEGDRILFPMLDAYGKCAFEGRDSKGHSPDWRRWDGTAMGYEGYLTDNYYALLAVPLRQSEISWREGFRPLTLLT